MNELSQAIHDLDRLDKIEAEIKELHDRVCTPGMHLAEREAPLGELGHYIRDDLYLMIGKLWVEERRRANELFDAPKKTFSEQRADLGGIPPIDPGLEKAF